MNFSFAHFNFNVLDLEKSLKFYKEALGLEPVRRKELTYLRDRKEPYNLGELEYHLALETDDMEAAHKLHEEMGVICYENPGMGIYFISDPDGYWIEIVPKK